MITDKEYITRAAELRYKINTLCDDLGAVYSTRAAFLEKVLNDIINGDFETIDTGSDYHAHKIITVKGVTTWNNHK